jgi:2-methylcitrate dehydratase
MFDGDLNNESYAPEKLRDPRIRAFMRKITVKEDSSFGPPRGSAPPTRFTVTLNDGRRIVRQVDGVPGFAGQPMTRADVEKKFRGNVGNRWPPERTDTVLQSLWALEQTGEIRSLMGKLVA